MSDCNPIRRSSVAVAIIHQDGKYLMQLRDDIAGIAYPRVWGFFGGHLEPGELPKAGLRRELIEEIGYRADRLTRFRSMEIDRYVRHLFHCSLTVPIETLKLNEGQDMKLLTKTEIERGKAYSFKARADKPLGDIHRQIMLDFIATIESN